MSPPDLDEASSPDDDDVSCFEDESPSRLSSQGGRQLLEVLPEFLDPHVVLSQNNNAMSKSMLLSSLFDRLGIDDAERESMLLQKLDEIMPASDDNLLALQMWALLADQTVGNVDYARAGCGWNHPESRSEYRRRTHASFHSNITRERRKKDRKRLVDTLEGVVLSDGGGNTNALVSAAVELFAEMSGCRAVGADAPTEEGVLQALRAEGLVPLRALCECAKSRVTMSGASIPSEPYETAVRRLAEAVIRGTWRSLRYDAASGDVRQLAALDDATRSAWSFLGRCGSVLEPGRFTTWDGVVGTSMHRLVLEEARKRGRPIAILADTLELLWATKIGGPSHGFDYEPQCHLPLLMNARHKAIVVVDAGFEHHPAFRSHVRLLQVHGGDASSHHVYLEPLNACFSMNSLAKHAPDYGAAVRAYAALAITLAAKLHVPLSFEPGLRAVILDALQSEGFTPHVIRPLLSIHELERLVFLHEQVSQLLLVDFDVRDGDEERALRLGVHFFEELVDCERHEPGHGLVS